MSNIELPYPTSIYGFECSELRTIQSMCDGDNESFLNVIADMIGKRDAKIDELKKENHYLKYEVDEEGLADKKS